MVGLHGSPLRKPYSIASAPSETARTGHIELLVQVDDSGGPDPHLERAAPGTRLDVEGPFGSFSLPSVEDEPALLMVAGGTGIAPLRSMMIEALNRPVPPRISLVYSARSVDELAYRDELEALAAAGRIRPGDDRHARRRIGVGRHAGPHRSADAGGGAARHRMPGA